MPRVKLTEENKRKTVAFTLKGSEIAALDKLIDEYNTLYGMDIMTRQNLIAGLVLNYIDGSVKKSRS